MIEMKYIIVRDQDEKEHAVLFPKTVVHAEVGALHNVRKLRVISAGFCQVQVEAGGIAVAAYGESESLRKQARANVDAEIIRKGLTDGQKENGR